ncbi:CHAP domain-containing protein [Ktedonospora formicarum]|uniref:Peptidase C51 domain-containing protein n=1 Tax=Ktedonospora formicarum TaxID=2778364 RepID=A0A8J3HYR7_9CHLR|nr:CHAP domain-containing protein [Ktedonospora formicarum]GHO43478.1 hypothetical protein KSX_16410 [Ktedonospora formicarum]
MSSIDQKPNSVSQQYREGSPFASGFAGSDTPMEQLPFPESPAATGAPIQGDAAPGDVGYSQTGPIARPGVSGVVFDGTDSHPRVTRQLTLDTTTGHLPVMRSNTTALRQPVVIKGTGKSALGFRPPKGRRVVIHVAVTALLLIIMGGTLLAVTATQAPAKGGPNGILNIIFNIKDSKGNNTALLPEQAATATAVTQDGYDAGNQTYPGVNGGPALGGTGNRFFQGQCTYWAAYRFHQLHGVWVPWLGNAWEWLGQAQAYGWKVSAQPTVGSILVLQPGVQGAGGYGHVAIVESINSDGTVHTSNYNWYAGGGGFGILSYWDFSYPAYPGVAFVTV